ncbi:membrane protein [Rhodopirellula sp. SWK7]|uniref:membrane protein n=1 Tax=Rhodopirellula sp. SWK7 TaxID=595460 RepID=UPI0002BFA0B3|nr:membrane protein [Rhodopirellula sp. SWK7]EMI43039.1 putative membrane protein [Rhodopirellula sp. SWK7]
MEEVSLQPKHYLTCLWPGMAELWWRGRFSALPAAIAFAAVVNALLVAKFIYSDWLSGGLVLLACWVVAAAWVVLTIRAIRELPLLLTPLQASEEPDRFPEAQIAFLRGDYPEAEKLLGENLAIEPRDPPALLLLSAIYRHTGRLHASKLLLTEIRKLEVADNWGLEFAAEQARLERDIEAREESESEGHPDEDDDEGASAESGESDSGESENPVESENPAENENAGENEGEPGNEDVDQEIVASRSRGTNDDTIDNSPADDLAEDLVDGLAADQCQEHDQADDDGTSYEDDSLGNRAA